MCAAVSSITIQMILSLALVHRAAGGRRGHVQCGGGRCTIIRGAACAGFGDAGAQNRATERACAQCAADVEESCHAVAAHHNDAVLRAVHATMGTLVG